MKKTTVCALLLSSVLPAAAITYVDASPANTTLADGSPYTPTATVINDDNQWSLRTFGNNGTVYTANDSSLSPGEDAPMLRTSITGLEANMEYEISVYFWVAGSGVPTGNQPWDIRAGLAPDAMNVIRHNTPGALRLDTSGVTFTNSVLVTEADRRLFQFILGTAVATGDGEIQVFVDDVPGDVFRTWYDGVGFAPLAPPEPAVWVGLGQGGEWSDAANWLSGSPPAEGDELVFGDALGLDPFNDLPADRSYASLRFITGAGPYQFTGNRLSLAGPLINQAAASQTLDLDLLLDDDMDVNVIAGAIFLDGGLSGVGGLNKSGQGMLELTAENRHAGRTTVVTGPVRVFGDQRQAAGGWWVGPGTAAPTTVTFSEDAVIRVAEEHGIRVGANTGSAASSLAAQTLSVLGKVDNEGSLETGLQAFVSLEPGGRWEQRGPMAIRAYNNWNSRLTILSGDGFHYLGDAPVILRAGTGQTGRGRIVMNGGLFVTGAGFIDENPAGTLRPLIELREDGTLRASGPIEELANGVDILLGFETGVIDTAEHAVSASGALSGPGNLAKEGSGTLNLAGGGLHAGATFVRQGRLVVSEPVLDDQSMVQITAGATLELDHAANDVIGALVIDGVARAPGIWGGPSSGAPNTNPALAGTGTLQIITADAYSAWIDGFASLVTPADREKSADPDGDGLNNLGEFALDGDPTSPAASGKIHGQFATLAGGSAFTLTLPVRDGSTVEPGEPAGGEFVLVGDGVRYRIQSSPDLASWLLDVAEVTGADAAAIQSPLPQLTPGWSYRTFRGSAPPEGNPAEFLRVAIEESP